MQQDRPYVTHTPMQQQSTSVQTGSTPDFTNYNGWNRVIVRFMKTAGLVQALSGFENDMLVMNQDFEKEDIPSALQQLYLDLAGLSRNEVFQETKSSERRLEHVHLANDATPVSHTQLIRSISTFIAQTRARNNISNRNEFLRKRRRLDPGFIAVSQEESPQTSQEIPTCARTDAIPVNRDVQMKYDVAKNEDGPLRRTVKSEPSEVDLQPTSDSSEIVVGPGIEPTLQRHPGFAERFANLEAHLAVRYVPSPPASLLDRVRYLENHIIRLEREYPPWAALHFNQPNRGWPPPPRTTPLVVPSHLTSTSNQLWNESGDAHDQSSSVWSLEATRPGQSKPKAKAKSSSLHRAVMDKLEVKKALAGED